MQTTPVTVNSLAPAGHIHLYDQFPALRNLPRVPLCITPSPVEPITGIAGASDLWIKRDDLNADECGGNKVRALEFLLGAVEPGDTVVTLGGAGSTHVLATLIHARRIGAKTLAVRWQHDMNPVARIVSERLGRELGNAKIGRTVLGTILHAQFLRLARRPVYFVPIGGSSPLGALGHVNAGLELASQIHSGALPLPRRIVLPLATGGTMAGLSLGLAIARLDIPIIGARVTPRVYANRGRVQRIAHGTAQLIAGFTGHLPRIPDPGMLTVVHDVYGGAYGRPMARAAEAAATLSRVLDLRLDATYSAKAFAAALRYARDLEGPTLFWLTFDARCLTS